MATVDCARTLSIPKKAEGNRRSKGALPYLLPGRTRGEVLSGREGCLARMAKSLSVRSITGWNMRLKRFLLSAGSTPVNRTR